MIQFYTRGLTRCQCGKPATVEVMGTGNVRYATCCDRCAKKKIRELERRYNAVGRGKEASHAK